MGGYVSQDPIGLAGGNPTLYGYVSDPLELVDPLGLSESCNGAGTQRWKNKKTKDGSPYRKPGPKTDLNAPHNKKINDIIEVEKAKGMEHMGGGNLTEVVVTTKGGHKPYRRMDASFKDPETGELFHHNVGKSNRKRGDAIARERRAIEDVENFAPRADNNITFHSYGTT